jgi:hypothetical protein
MHKLKKNRPVNIDKRPRYDEGGRHPLTRDKMIPTVVCIDWPLWEEIEKRVNEFINPMTLKPYGISALCRVLVSQGIELLESIKRDDLLDYVPDAPKGSTGRFPLSDEGQVKLSVALRSEDVVKINQYVDHFNSSLIGTTTIVRLLIRMRLQTFNIGELYKHIPERHKDHMLEASLTIKDLQSRWSRRKNRKIPPK